MTFFVLSFYLRNILYMTFLSKMYDLILKAIYIQTSIKRIRHQIASQKHQALYNYIDAESTDKEIPGLTLDNLKESI